MQFSNYSDFKNKVQTLLDGDDISESDLSSSVLDTIIGLGEVRIYRDLRTSAQDLALPITVVTTGNSAPLPADYLELKGAPYLANYRTSTYAPWEEIQNYIQVGCLTNNAPLYYSFEGDNLIFYPPQPDGTVVNGRYYSRLPDVSQGLNAVFLRHPDLFVYAALAESGPFLGEATRTPVWTEKYAELIQEANEQERRRITRGSKLQTRVA